MKPTTREWINAAEDDLLSAQKLLGEERLTNVVAFHCQQAIEKGLKALLEEMENKSIKSHDLLRLQEMVGISVSKDDAVILATINEVYIDARYPGDMGLMPHGKPSLADANEFLVFSQALLKRIEHIIQRKEL